MHFLADLTDGFLRRRVRNFNEAQYLKMETPGTQEEEDREPDGFKHKAASIFIEQGLFLSL